MKELLREVFLHLGAELREEEQVLAVTLPAVEEGPAAELAAALGQRELRLVFDSAHLTPGSELVAPGSHLLRQVDELLARRARRAYVERPAEHRLTLAAVKALVAPARGHRLALEARNADSGWDVWVVYRVRYHTRERTDAIETVRVTLRPGAPLLAEPGEPPPGFEAWPAAPRKRAPEELLQAALGAADAQVEARARAQAQEIGAEARRKLQRDAGRMEAYYAAQMAELTRGSRRREGAELKLEELQEEQELRLRELAQAAEVRVEVEALQLLTAEVPLARARLAVRSGAARKGEPAEEEEEAGAEAPPDCAAVEVLLDRSSGELRLAPCQACGESLVGGQVAACAGLHAAHPACLASCAGCRRSTCAACGVAACAACQRRLCAACLATCRHCERPSCAEHLGTCAVCALDGCARCLSACAHCGQRVCAEHRHAAAEGAEAAFCVRCAQPCPACGTATPEPEQARCGTCGRRFCRACCPPEASLCRLCGAG